MVWCGVVWGMVWCMVWGMVWGMVWLVWCKVWLGTAWYGKALHVCMWCDYMELHGNDHALYVNLWFLTSGLKTKKRMDMWP